jgi:hypothetical protein
MKNKLNNKNEKTIFKCGKLFWLTLPLALAAGCASNPSNSFFKDAPAPAVAAVSGSRTANVVVGKEIFNMFMADTNIDYDLLASVNEGTVTLVGTSTDRPERQRMVNQIWTLAGVNQVNDEPAVNTLPTLAEEAVAR